MLLSLNIKDYAIIEQLNIQFQNGFSVITGETGAGKSIIMGALSLVLGQRADIKNIRTGASKCSIEAFFDIAPYNLEAFFEENDLDYETTCIIRREVLLNGKSRAFINDTPISLNILKDFSEKLIDIHSQHANLLLKDDDFQLKVVDIIAKNENILTQYKFAYKEMKSILSEIERLKEEYNKNIADKDYLQFQVEQLQKAELKEEEQTNLEEELETLQHAEEIKKYLDQSYQLLENEENGIISRLKEIHNALIHICRYMPEAQQLSERIESCYIETKDIVEEINNQQNKIEFDPQHIDAINQRLDLIYSLQKKHHVNNNKELLSILKDLEKKLNDIQTSDNRIITLQKKCDNITKEIESLATEISALRKKTAQKISKEMEEKLNLLGMSNVRFDISITEQKNLQSTGKDYVEFLFSSNKNSAMQAVSKIASGGEIARVMLSIKSLIANSKTLPTIIFDEIDTGISGEIANRMASIMEEMGTSMQVICITHLPQIAAKGKNHYLVYKDEISTNIKQLTKEERTKEIAQMLSGSSITEAAIQNAKELLQ